MAIVKIIDENRTVTDRQAVAEYLTPRGVRYEYWTPAHPVEADSPAEEILKAYAGEIERLKTLGGYVTADVIDVNAQTPGLDSMLEKFIIEYCNEVDEDCLFMYITVVLL